MKYDTQPIVIDTDFEDFYWSDQDTHSQDQIESGFWAYTIRGDEYA